MGTTDSKIITRRKSSEKNLKNIIDYLSIIEFKYLGLLVLDSQAENTIFKSRRKPESDKKSMEHVKITHLFFKHPSKQFLIVIAQNNSTDLFFSIEIYWTSMYSKDNGTCLDINFFYDEKISKTFIKSNINDVKKTINLEVLLDTDNYGSDINNNEQIIHQYHCFYLDPKDLKKNSYGWMRVANDLKNIYKLFESELTEGSSEIKPDKFLWTARLNLDGPIINYFNAWMNFSGCTDEIKILS